MSIPDRERKAPGEGKREDDFSGEQNRAPMDEGTVEPVDLDGDGFIGNTGGFYGGTSYLGSNYGEDWNRGPASNHPQQSNLGAAGQNNEADNERNDEDPGEDAGRITKDDRII